MKYRPILPVFAVTLFLSAFLIFAIQPMVSKLLLPLMGGGPSVWNTAMVFFQAILLAGYAYAHLSAKYLPLKAQAILHVTLLGLFTLCLPLMIPAETTPPEENGQALWQLGLMFTCIGGPFFILAANAPLFQHWFTASGHKDAQNPYFLYAISNAGSMLALLGYPFVIEPLLKLSAQSSFWLGGYALLILLAAISAIMVGSGTKVFTPLTHNADRASPDWNRRLIWLAFAFIPSSLMLGVTTHITTDLASTPLLWVAPLALYLLTFIIAFAKEPLINFPALRIWTAYGIGLIVIGYILGAFITPSLLWIFVHLGTFFLCALLCHGELAKLRPTASHLTEFYLLVSIGGVMGGIFNALLAPKLFSTPMEYSLTLALVGFVIWAGAARIPAITLRFNTVDDRRKKNTLLFLDGLMLAIGLSAVLMAAYTGNRGLQLVGSMGAGCFVLLLVKNRSVFAIFCIIALPLLQTPHMWSTNRTLLDTERNYFGIIRVIAKDNVHYLNNGTTLHGAQYRDDARRRIPTTYYNTSGPAADIFSYMDKKAVPQKIAALGLGVGSISCYAAPDRRFDFYEINKSVADIAQNPNYFSFLKDCNSPYNIILGDARLKMAQAQDESYDLIFVDTFSSDNIPVHVMTKEAFEIYLEKLRPNGIIAINISNRYFDLRGPLDAIAANLNLSIAFKFTEPDIKADKDNGLDTASLYAVIGRTPVDIAYFMEQKDWRPIAENHNRVWTDDYANVLSSLKFLNQR